MKEEFDAIVVGGGPGGAVAATFLARANVKTLLIDKARFPRDKACGDAVGGQSAELLGELGLEPQLAQYRVARINGEIFTSPKGAEVQIPFAPRPPANSHAGPPVYIIRRMILDNLLFQLAKSHPAVTMLESFTVQDLLWKGTQVSGVIGQDQHSKIREFGARVVIGADGALSKVAEKVGSYDFSHKHHDHWIGAFRSYFEGVRGLTDNLEIHFVDGLIPGYFWIFPTGDGCANVGAGMLETDLRGERGALRKKKTNIRQVTNAIIASHPRFRPRFENAREVPGTFRGWQLPCGSERRKLAGNGWMLTGDAASLIDPFSGEGIPNAMLSGRFAAECAATALRAGDCSERILKSYEQRVWKELGPQLDISYRLQRIVRHKWLVNLIIGRAASSAYVRRTIAEMVADNTKAVQLTRPSFYLKMFLPGTS